MRSSVFGDHEDTASSYHELGIVQHGELKGALKSLQKALDTMTNLLGDHGDMTSSLKELRAVREKNHYYYFGGKIDTKNNSKL